MHTTIFSKYTELLQLKIFFRTFRNYFRKLLQINVFQDKNQSLCKNRACFLKMADIDRETDGFFNNYLREFKY